MKEMAANWLGNLTKSSIFRIVAAQFIATILASALCLVFDRVAAISALMAGITCIVPACYTLVVSLRPVTKGDPGLTQALRGEAGKFALTVALFALVFVFVKPLNVLVFFSTFVGLQLCMAVVLLLGSRRLLKR
jgi:ATP synthase protein I